MSKLTKLLRRLTGNLSAKALEADLVKDLSSEIVKEIDKQIIEELLSKANKTTSS